jgi:hypothetical protein
MEEGKRGDIWSVLFGVSKVLNFKEMGFRVRKW